MSQSDLCVICLSRDIYRAIIPVQRLLVGESEQPPPLVVGRAIAHLDTISAEYWERECMYDEIYTAVETKVIELRNTLDDQDRWDELDRAIQNTEYALKEYLREKERRATDAEGPPED